MNTAKETPISGYIQARYPTNSLIISLTISDIPLSISTAFFFSFLCVVSSRIIVRRLTIQLFPILVIFKLVVNANMRIFE